MSRIAQALHVARKDVRFTRVALLVYSALVAVMLVRVMSMPIVPGRVGPIADPFSTAMLILVLLGAILAASAVQSDSPVQGNAFWASRPFDPAAMVGAKVIYCAVVLIGVPLLAEAIGFLRFDTSAGAMTANLIKSFTMYGLVLLCAAVVASLTTDLRGFIVGSLVLVIGFFLAMTALLNRPGRPFGNPSLAWPLVVAVGGGIALLLVLYRRRDVGRVAWLGAVVVIGATFVVFEAIDAPHEDVPTTMRTTEISLDRAATIGMQVYPAMTPGDSRTRLPIRLTLTRLPASARVRLQVDSAFLHLGDGSVVQSAPAFGFMAPNSGLGALPPGIRRFGAPDDGFVVGTNLSFDADSALLASKGMRQLDLWARVFVAEATPLASTRVGTPIEATVDGTRLRISDDLATGSGTITLAAATVGDTRRSVAPNDIGLAVINETTREGIVLTSSFYGNSSSWMILPGAPVMTSVVRFDTNRPETEGAPVSGPFMASVGPLSERLPNRREGQFPEPSWYHGAKIVALQWVARGSYPVRLSKTLN